MSLTTDAWLMLYIAQTAMVGTITATVTGLGTDKKCIPNSQALDEILVDGGTGLAGQRVIQMLESDLSALPAKEVVVTVTQNAVVRSYTVLETPEVNNGIVYLSLGDRVTNE